MIQKLSILLLLFSLISFADVGFFAEDWKERSSISFNSFEEKQEPVSDPSIEVSIDVSQRTKKILPNIFGNNINPWLGRALLEDSSYALSHLKQAGITYLRLPGGNWANKMLWDGEIHWELHDDYLSELKGEPNQTWTITPDEMISIANYIGAKPQICVNLSLARYIPGPDSIEQAAHYAAEWVRHVNKNPETYTKYWEIGNENYGSWQAGYIVKGDTMDGMYYGKAFKIFADSMKSADPSIKLGAVVIEQDNGSIGYGGHNFWMKKMLPLIEDKADFLVYHEYFTWAENLNEIPTSEGLESLQAIKNAKDSIEAMVARYTNKEKDYFPIAVTEYNTRLGDRTNQAFSGLFIAMAIPEFIEQEYGLVNLWSIVDGYHEGEGDFGMLSEKEENVEAPYYTPRPSFYAYYLFQKMWGDIAIPSPKREFQNLYVACSRFSTNGDLAILMVNPTNQTKNIKLNLANFQSADSIYGFTVSATSETSKNIFLNGETGIYGLTNYEQISPWKRKTGNAKFELTPWTYEFVLFPAKEKEVLGLHSLKNNLLKPKQKIQRDALGKKQNKTRVHKIIY